MSPSDRHADEVEHVDECPACGMRFIGMTPDEFRETHAREDCPDAPLTTLFRFPKESIQVPEVAACDNCGEKRTTVETNRGSRLCKICLKRLPKHDRPEGYKND